MKRILCVLFCLCVCLTTVAAAEAPWSTSLSFDGGGVWLKRIPVTIENRSQEPMEGKSVGVNFGNRLQNVSAQTIRVALSDSEAVGQELLFDIHSEGKRIEDGSLDQTAIVSIPVDCEPGKSATYFVYFDNAQAEVVPEFLDVKPGFANGNMERGDGTMPDGWSADEDIDGYQNVWIDAESNSVQKSGKRCLKTVIEHGQKATWFAVRQSGVPVTGGVKYRVSGWVRGEDVRGRAGWFIHVGNAKNSQMVNNVQGNYEGTFDWKEIVFEFTAPKDADRLTIGTVLYGTGTAWFDDVSFEIVDAKTVAETTPKIEIGEIETIPLNVVKAETDWPKLTDSNYLCRSTFRIVNDSDKNLIDTPTLLTLRGTLAHGLLGPLTDLYVLDGKRKVPAILFDTENQRASTRIDVPARTVKYFNVYYKFDETKAPKGITSENSDNERNLEAETAHPELQAAADPFAGMPNMLKNGDFEGEPNTDGYPASWNRNDQNPSKGIRYFLETDPKIIRFGKRCAKLEVAEDAPEHWRGWTQRVEIQGGQSYLVQGWLRSEKIASARIHVHFHDAAGKHTQDGAMASVGPDISGTKDWTRLAEVITTPLDARFMTIHLTMNSTGTLWHDNVAVFEGLFAEQIDRESFLASTSANEPGSVVSVPLVWQVPAVMKVFPQTISTQIPQGLLESKSEWGDRGFGIESARNEKEPLQLAIRSNKARKLKIKVTAPKLLQIVKRRPSSAEKTEYPALNNFEINVIGYVPVDYPSNYYNTKTPKWYRKTPISAPGCDGWKGLWPDPLLPQDTIELKPNQTESVWITWSIPQDAKPGFYLGEVELLDGDQIAYKNLVGIKVHDFTLPDESHVSAIYDVRFGPGSKYWGKSRDAYFKEVVELMTENRLSPDAVVPEPKIEFKEGKFVFDWTKFDETAAWLINERKVRRLYTPHTFYSFGWGHPPRKFFDENPYEGEWPFTGEDFTKIRPEYRAKYQGALKIFWDHLKEKGWADRFVLYISDEPNYWQGKHIIDQMKAVCEMIHEVDPTIPIYSSTWKYIPEWLGSLDVWGIGHYGIVPVEKMNEIKNHGSRIWFTTDGMLCLDTPYNAIERLLPYYCFKYDAEAYEFWGVAWLTWNPYQRGDHAYIHQSSTPGEYYWVRYPNGDGYMIYPSNPIGTKKIVTSVRFEQAREGVEDFEYFYMLSNLVDKAKKEGRDTSQAEAALEAARSMVDCPSPIGRYSSKILPNPNRLYEVRRQVAEAIENSEHEASASAK